MMLRSPVRPVVGLALAARFALTVVALIPFLVTAGAGRAMAQARATAPEAVELADPRILVDLSAIPAGRAAELAELLPEWEEAIAAGTEQLSLPASRLVALRDAGFAIQVLDEPAQVQPLAPWPACYRKLDAVYGWLQAYAAEHAELVDFIDIGDSWCKTQGGCTTPGGDRLDGRDLLVARITAEGAIAPKEGRLFIDGGIHARELPSVELMLATIEGLVEGYGQDPQISYLLDHREVYVGIATNPDGRQLVELGAEPPYASAPWLWRKNANDSASGACGWPPRGGHFGIDLNRNQAFKWDAEGHSDNPCSETYRGTEPASEPEIQAYEAFVRSLFEDRRGPGDDDAAPRDSSGMLVNYHNATWPGTMLVPWGWTETRSPNDADLVAIANRYAAFNGYKTQYSLYPVSGNTRDWGYGELGIPAYVVELQGRDFVSPCAELPGILRQNLPAIEMLLGLADLPYERIRGPELTRVSLSPIRSAVGERVRLRARATELRSGGDPIHEVRVAAAGLGGLAVGGLPEPGGAPGDGLAMEAEDGAFDERSEWVVLDLDISGLLPGRYYLTLRGRDAAGSENSSWGPAVALWLDVASRNPLGLSSASRPAVDFD
ncbi:MAG: hypothetical protein H6648_00125 [Caldilineae bacterium]|nr:hypothetical protein [Caldilineae bacterium]